MNTLKKHPLNIAITTLALLGWNNVAQAQTVTATTSTTIPKAPFAAIPLNLIDITVTKAGNPPKPNIMLFLDDSQSMSYSVPGSNGATRLDITKEAIKSILTDKNYKDHFNWNIFTLWNTTGYYEKFTTADKVKNSLEKIGHKKNTPTSTRYLQAIKLLTDNINYTCQKSYLIMMSDGEANDDNYNYKPNKYVNAQFANKNLYFSSDFFDDYFLSENYWADFWPQSSQPSRDKNWGWSAKWLHNYYGLKTSRPNYVGPDYGAGISFFSETLNHKDLKTTARDGKDKEGTDWDEEKQTIRTYTIGLGDEFDSGSYACRYLRNAASINPNDTAPSDYTQEPACPENNKGRFFFTAKDQEKLSEAFTKAVQSAYEDSVVINDGINTTSTSTPTTAGSRIPELAAYFSLDTEKWASALYFNAIEGSDIKNDKKTPASFPAEHPIIVNTGTDTFWIADTSENFYGIASEIELKKGLIPWLQRPASTSDKQIEAQVASAIPDSAGRTVKSYRVRTKDASDILRQMSDVIGAPTISVGKNANGKDKYVITAANDGFVYIFKRTSDDSNPYELALNYLPGAMQRESADDSDTVAKALRAVAEKGYGKEADQPHLYLNDGGITYRTTPETASAGKQSFIVGAMGKGGRGVYALNIGGKDRTNPAEDVALDANNILGSSPGKKLTDVPLWETEKGTANMLGYTVGIPQIGQIATNWSGNNPDFNSGVRFLALFGNGYPTNPENSAIAPVLDSQPTLYAYEALGQEAGMSGAKVDGDAPGTQVAKVSVSDGFGGLASPTLVDTNFDGIVDLAYAGDYGGNLYRFNLKDAPDKWSAVKIYQGKADHSQPITAAPAVYRQSAEKFIVIFGTGSDLYQEDLERKDRQAIIGVYDDLTQTPSSSDIVKYDDLLEQTIAKTADDKRYLSNNALDPKTHKGWRVMLDENNGERVVVKPQMLLSTAFLTTRSYEVNKTSTGTGGSSGSTSYSCSPITEETTTSTGESWIMAINALTGGFPDRKDGAYLNPPTGSSGSGSSGTGSSGGSGTGSSGSVLSGIKTDGLASAVVLYDNQSNNLMATTPNGDAGGNGLGDKLTGRSNEQTNKCLDSDGYNALYSDGSGPKNIPISGELCPASVTRVNYREVPL